MHACILSSTSLLSRASFSSVDQCIKEEYSVNLCQQAEKLGSECCANESTLPVYCVSHIVNKRKPSSSGEEYLVHGFCLFPCFCLFAHCILLFDIYCSACYRRHLPYCHVDLPSIPDIRIVLSSHILVAMLTETLTLAASLSSSHYKPYTDANIKLVRPTRASGTYHIASAGEPRLTYSRHPPRFSYRQVPRLQIQYSHRCPMDETAAAAQQFSHYKCKFGPRTRGSSREHCAQWTCCAPPYSAHTAQDNQSAARSLELFPRAAAR